MTRIATGLDVFRGIGGSSIKQRVWFMTENTELQMGVESTDVSGIIADKTIIKAVSINVAQRNQAMNSNVIVQIFLTQSTVPSQAEMDQAEPIIRFRLRGVPNELFIIGSPQDLHFDCEKVVQGSDNRIGIHLIGQAATRDIGRVGVWYEEP